MRTIDSAEALSFALSLAQFFLLYVALFVAYMAWSRVRREKRQQAEQDQKETLDSKLRLLAESSARAASLAAQVNVEIDAMTATAEKARADASEAERIAALTDEDRAAVASMVRRELGTELKGRDRRGIWANVLLSFTFFVLGVVASVVVTMNVRPSDPAPPESPTSIGLEIPIPLSV